jgi:hypothetical protein
MAMLFFLICDQDLSFKNSISTVPGIRAAYDKEEIALGLNISNYYIFSKNFYTKITIYRMLAWSGYAYFAGIVMYFLPFYAFGMGVINIEGKSDDLWAAGQVSFYIAQLIFHLTVFLQVRNWTWILAMACTLSIFILPIFIPVVEEIDGVGIYINHRQISELIIGLNAPIFYLILLLGCTVVAAPIYGFKCIKMVIAYP